MQGAYGYFVNEVNEAQVVLIMDLSAQIKSIFYLHGLPVLLFLFFFFFCVTRNLCHKNTGLCVESHSSHVTIKNIFSCALDLERFRAFNL